MKQTIKAQDNQARVTTIETAHGTITTPAFMPVATHGAVKGVSMSRVRELGADIILSNTYHLYLRPGVDQIVAAGGLHKFMGWDRPILTDSGGFQVFSLGHKRGGKLAKIDDEGVTFQSHLDGSTHRFTPELVLDLQQKYGVDIAMPLDECPPADAPREIIARAVERTHAWLKRASDIWHAGPQTTALFGIIQGGIDRDLRAASLEAVTANDLAGYALGGLAVGESRQERDKIVAWLAPQLPADRPRYLMGVGEPLDLLWAIGWGIDLFDCVIPTRLARHGSVWVVEGEDSLVKDFWAGETDQLLAEGGSLNIVRHTYPREVNAHDDRPVQPFGPTTMTRRLANHLAKEREFSLWTSFSEQNLAVIFTLLAHARAAISQERYADLLTTFGLTLSS